MNTSRINSLVFATALMLVRLSASAIGAEKMKVIATISILGDLVQHVGGDDVDLTTLVGCDGDPHEYQPVPADSLKLAQAAVIVENGLGLEPWLSKLAESAGTQASRVIVAQGIEVRHASPPEGGRPNGNGDDRDPHAWQNVRNAIVMVNNIRDALAKADPPHASAFQSRADAYDRQLLDLDASIESKIHALPPERRKLVTSHDSFGYFGQRYGMDVSQSVLQSMTTEAADPSARQMARVIDAIKASHVPVVFLENIQNPKLINQIAGEAGVKVGPPLYSDALGKAGSDGDTYLRMMTYNANTLVNALKP